MAVPILGQAGPNDGGLTANCDIHDSEVGQIQNILDTMRRKAEYRVDYDAYDREMRERFEDLGFIISINWYTTNVEGTLIPEIVIRDRTEKKAFDHDQKVHEITNDILGLGDSGVIKFDPSQIQKHEH